MRWLPFKNSVRESAKAQPSNDDDVHEGNPHEDDGAHDDTLTHADEPHEDDGAHAHATVAHAHAFARHLALGRRGEVLAAEHLVRCGYRLVAANFKANVGRNRRGAHVQAEIDLVAYEGPTLCFVEVKTRASDWFAAPEANVDLRKQRQITRAARAYRRIYGLNAAPFRYDVLTVILPPPDRQTGLAPPPRLQLLKNFWTDEKFRKRRWTQR